MRFKKFLALLSFILLAVLLVSCNGTEEPKKDDPIEKTIEGITLNDKTVTYDGNNHSIEISGNLPAGGSVTYENNNKSEPGTYTVKAEIKAEGYKTLKLTATLTINKAVFSGITFTDKTVDYNGHQQTILIDGAVPGGANVSYTTNTYVEVGTYEVTVTISKHGYETLVLTATLTIRPYGDEVFTGITFENKVVTYDGLEHAIFISGGLPEGATVTYSSTTPCITNKATEVGTYTITAVIEKTGYQTLTLQADLIITPSGNLTFDNATFDDLTVEYDSFEHEIIVEGVLPEGTNIVYTSDVEGVTNSASEVGVYNVTATLSKTGYETKVLQAKLKIKAVDKQRAIFVNEGVIYFANGLDKEYLYSINGGTIARVNKDEASYFTMHNNQMHYVSNSLISSSIKSFDGTDAQSLYRVKAEYLFSDGVNLYYALNPLIGDKGIYKLQVDAENPVLTRVFIGKATHLTLVDNDIYFINGEDDKIYKINKNLVEGIPTLVVDQKVTEMIYYNGSLYYTANNLLGNYLERYILASDTKVKLTTDNAKYLVEVDGYIYYSNVDILTSNVFGKGLYRVKANILSNTNSPGELVYETTYNVSSLYKQDNNTLLFYRIEDKHLLSINLTTSVVTDLLEGYVPPTYESLQLNPKYETNVWNNRVYYINNFDEGKLYYYNTKTNAVVKVTANPVKSFSIIGNYLYYNEITWFVNNDMFMINLKTGGEAQLVTNNDGRDMVIHNGHLYYVKANATGVGTQINSINLNGFIEREYPEEPELMKNAYNLAIYNGKLYYITGASTTSGNIMIVDINPDGSLGTPQKVSDEKTTYFQFVGNEIYFRRLYGIGNARKALSKMNLDGTGMVDLITSIDPVAFLVYDGFIYYTNVTTLGPKNGIYKVGMDGLNPELIYENDSNGTGLAVEMQIVGNYLYYYSVSEAQGDRKLHRLNLTTYLSEIIE